MQQSRTLESISVITFPIVLKSSFSIKYKIILGIFWFFSVASIIVLLIFYIWQINSEISQKYSVQQQKAVSEKLTKENNILEAEFANANSLDNIASAVNGLNFEKVEKINYIRVLDNQVVAR